MIEPVIGAVGAPFAGASNRAAPTVWVGER